MYIYIYLVCSVSLVFGPPCDTNFVAAALLHRLHADAHPMRPHLMDIAIPAHGFLECLGGRVLATETCPVHPNTDPAQGARVSTCLRVWIVAPHAADARHHIIVFIVLATALFVFFMHVFRDQFLYSGNTWALFPGRGVRRL